jgi:hypothetical protein
MFGRTKLYGHEEDAVAKVTVKNTSHEISHTNFEITNIQVLQHLDKRF